MRALLLRTCRRERPRRSLRFRRRRFGVLARKRHSERVDVADCNDRIVFAARVAQKPHLIPSKRKQSGLQVAREIAHVSHRDQTAARHRAARTDLTAFRRRVPPRRARGGRRAHRALSPEARRRCARRSPSLRDRCLRRARDSRGPIAEQRHEREARETKTPAREHRTRARCARRNARTDLHVRSAPDRRIRADRACRDCGRRESNRCEEREPPAGGRARVRCARARPTDRRRERRSRTGANALDGSRKRQPKTRSQGLPTGYCMIKSPKTCTRTRRAVLVGDIETKSRQKRQRPSLRILQVRTDERVTHSQRTRAKQPKR